ncbi:hypothetical protein [Dactylosporangium salmoneum]|uniref:AAA+ ATPase domain-containing protein n=1 Tax=Dactylosporangium salmoneum TaxID=53361 RepID=A0ABN3HDB4_9ACTN
MTVMTYRSAVELLARDDPKLVESLDRALGLGLVAANAVSPLAALPYFEAKSAFIGQLEGLTGGLRARVRGSRRLEYEQLIAASHAVIVMAAFSQELAACLHRLDEDGKWRETVKAWRVAGSSPDGRVPARKQPVVWSNLAVVALPGPARSFEKVTADLRRVYVALARQALEYLQGFGRWDGLPEARRRAAETALRSPDLLVRAVDRYREHYLRLADEVPEFLVWTLLSEPAESRDILADASSRGTHFDKRLPEILDRLAGDLDALRAMLQDGAAALGDLPSAIASLAPKETAGDPALTGRIAECNRVHQLVLSKPLLTPRLDADLEGLTFPENRAGYISPNFRIYETRRSDEGTQLAQEQWWDDCPLRRGLGVHLGAYFRTEEATRRPLLVLGDPGSGKSLLSKVLAAQLPSDEFAVARVELRHVRLTQEVSDQVDLELQRQTNKRLTLADLTDADGRIVRVVIMDGLDELLQLSSQEGLGRYLEKLAEFQEVEAAYGRPVIAIATARTIVMDRVYVPSQTTVVKLEAFTDEQIGSWIAVWNDQNGEYFARRGLERLSTVSLGRYSELARQPLLLALLALYDAEDNALNNTGTLSQAELYERLFRRYLEREIGKESLPIREQDRDQQVEQRFRELATIAMGMLNRGRRFITRQELEQDYRALGLSRAGKLGNEHVVSADDAVGQFFFLYRAMAQHRGSVLNEGYEFIHATFGEFLGARMVAHQLAQAAAVTQRAPVWDRAEAERHARSLLIPHLARRPLAGEEQVLSFLSQIMGGLVGSRAEAATAIAGLMPSVLRAGADDAIGSIPDNQDRFERMATFSVNLVLAALHTAADPVPLSAFCLPGQDPGGEWRRLTVLWRTYLATDDWDRILGSLVLVEPQTGGPAIRMGSAKDLDRGAWATLEPAVRKFDLHRTVLEARLVGDRELAAAGTAWSHLRMELALLEGAQEPGLDPGGAQWRLAAAIVRSAPTVVSEGAAEQAVLHELSAHGGRILEIVDGGLGTWDNHFLRDVAALIADVVGPDVRGSFLLRLIRETDDRGHSAEARRLLQRLPDADLAGLTPADIASIVALSRRHQLHGLICRCIVGSKINGSVLERLGMEDVVWLMEGSGLSSESLARIRDTLMGSAQYIRMTQAGKTLMAFQARAPQAP